MSMDMYRLPMSNRGKKSGWGFENNCRDSQEYLPELCQLLKLNEQVMKKLLENTEKKAIPLWEKRLLTLEEASVLFGIGINRLRLLSDDSNCPFVLWNQSKRLIKREQLEKYLEKAYSI